MKRMLFVCIAGMFLLFPGNVPAGENVLGLDATSSYDIYLEGADGLSVISDVDIVGFRDVKDMAFLVFRSRGFNSQKNEGLVALKYLRAVLPTNRGAAIATGQRIRVR